MTVLEQQFMETIMYQIKEINKNLSNISDTLENIAEKGGENNDR